MAFHNVRFPTGISYGSGGGPGFKTTIIETGSGHEHRISRWSQAKHRFNAENGVKSVSQVAELKAFYLNRDGSANSFRYKDFDDFRSSIDSNAMIQQDDQILGTGDGVATQFQLIKQYASGPYTKNRTITKPVSGTMLVERAGVLLAESTDYTVDYGTGVITFNSAPGVGQQIAAGFEFDVPCRFGEGADELLDFTMDDYESNSASVPIVEVPDEIPLAEDFFYGGSSYVAGNAGGQISIANGRVQRFAPSLGVVNWDLPDPANLAAGGPWFYITNSAVNGNVVVRNELSATLVTLTAGQTAICILSKDSGGNKQWRTLN